MKVVFCIRPDWKSSHGGDGVQLVKTMEALQQAHGLEASIATEPSDPALATADIVHIFNIQTAEISLEFAQSAKRQGKPIALSTIYWDLSHARFVDAMGAKVPKPGWRSLKSVFDSISSLTAATLGRPRYLTKQRRAVITELLTSASVLLPNSVEEGEIVSREFGVSSVPIMPVVNAIDETRFTLPPSGVARNGVAVVGRIQPIKGQLTLMEALKDRRDVPITIVGAKQDAAYAEAVEKAAGEHGNTRIISGLSPDEVASLLQATSVHVLPSFRESPGLSSLEALACGARAVVAGREFCPVETYFSELIGSSVFVADPYDPTSIRSAVDQALSSTAYHDLAVWKTKFTWTQAAKQTYAAYEQVLSR